MALHTKTHADERSGDAPRIQAVGFVDHLRIAALVAAADGSIVHANEPASNWFAEGADLRELFAEAQFVGHFDGFADELQRAARGDRVVTHECVVASPGTQSRSLVTLRFVPATIDPDGDAADCVVVMIEQKAEQTDLQERVEVSRRLASLGKLAARVAHELNNPLDGILRYVNLAMRVAGETPDGRLKNYLTESRTGLMRMVQIIGDLLEFSRSTDGQFEQTSINEVVEQAMRNLSSAADSNGVVMAADFHRADMPCVRGGRLYQVICNLIKNAIDAMSDGGRLVLTTGIVGEDVMIEVADTGPGLPADAAKVFEPFFTTKGAGKGTGIGLAICKDFIEDMGGTIQAANGSGGGAVFTVRLPVASCVQPSPLTEPGPDKP